jgi:hypothetical protein
MSTIFEVEMPCTSETARRFGGTKQDTGSFRSVCAGFLRGSYDPEFGADMFLRNVGLCPNCTALQSRK